MGHTITQPKFPVGIVTPALHNSIGRKGTGVTCTSTDVDKHGSYGRHSQHWGEAPNDGTVTNLPSILPPTVGNTTTCQCTGMTPACANGAKRDPRGHCQQGRRCGVGGRTIAELFCGIQPPTVGNPASSKCTDIVATHTY